MKLTNHIYLKIKKKLENYNKENYWIKVSEIDNVCELPLAHVFSFVKEQKIKIYLSDKQNLLYYEKDLKFDYALDQDVCVNGIIAYDPRFQRIWFPDDQKKLPRFLSFFGNEITGQFCFEFCLGEYDFLCRCKNITVDKDVNYSVRYILKEYDPKKNKIITTSHLIPIVITYYDNYRYNEEFHFSSAPRPKGLTLEKKDIFNTKKNEKYKELVDETIDSLSKQMEKSLSTKDLHKLAMIQVVCPNHIENGKLYTIYGVPEDCYNQAKNRYFPQFEQYANNPQAYADISECAFYEYYFIKRYHKVDNCEGKDLSVCNFNEHDYQLDWSKFFIKTEDLLSIIIKMSLNYNSLLEKWDAFPVTNDKEKDYIDFARMKFEGKSANEIHENIVITYKKAETNGSASTQVSNFANEVKQFAEKHSLPLWLENRGRKVKND